MIAGKPVEINILGGSVSAGAVATRKMDPVNPNDVWSLVRLQLQTRLSPKVQFYNNARSATKSLIFSMCLPRWLNATADLVFVEFIANDGSEMDTSLDGPLDKTRSYERFLRKIQQQPSNPAVVMMQARNCGLSILKISPGLCLKDLIVWGKVLRLEPWILCSDDTKTGASCNMPHRFINLTPAGVTQIASQLWTPERRPDPATANASPADAGERDGLPARRPRRQGQARVLLHPRGQLRQPGAVLRHPHHLIQVLISVPTQSASAVWGPGLQVLRFCAAQNRNLENTRQLPTRPSPKKILLQLSCRRDALWQLGDNGRDGMSWDDFMGPDRLHPNDRGHRLMADMVIYLMQQTAVDLLVHPLSHAEVAASAAPLPPPMFAGERVETQRLQASGREECRAG
jgi:hypothetical protein